jgi:hypothetical protein
MKNLKKFKDLLNEGFFDQKSVDFLSRLGGVLKDTLSSSVNPEYQENEVELTGASEPGGSPAESSLGKGLPLKKSVTSLSSKEYDSFGASMGIRDKSDDAPLEQPSRPIGNLVNSAYANINVSTRKIPGTGGGNLGCAAGTAIIFYRATGYSIAGGTKIPIGTATIYEELDKKSKDPMGSWKKITDWQNSYKPGDIIITKRGSRAGHIGVVVNDGLIISNSSGGFAGDKRGQIEPNYTIKSWESVAKRNPSETCLFRYQGPYKTSWS